MPLPPREQITNLLNTLTTIREDQVYYPTVHKQINNFANFIEANWVARPRSKMSRRFAPAGCGENYPEVSIDYHFENYTNPRALTIRTGHNRRLYLEKGAFLTSLHFTSHQEEENPTYQYGLNNYLAQILEPHLTEESYFTHDSLEAAWTGFARELELDLGINPTKLPALV